MPLAGRRTPKLLPGDTYLLLGGLGRGLAGIIETGTDSFRLATTRARAEEPSKAG
ncbi:hypothetical protein [Streptomyces sp. 3N207]|uniref:hypothetical protein n=1 Tax=Streptomyces sp. 3N207 TaxID=3457417 RepID=UPI003FD650F7